MDFLPRYSLTGHYIRDAKLRLAYQRVRPQPLCGCNALYSVLYNRMVAWACYATVVWPSSGFLPALLIPAIFYKFYYIFHLVFPKLPFFPLKILTKFGKKFFIKINTRIY
jgi:hypothetical protein